MVNERHMENELKPTSNAALGDRGEAIIGEMVFVIAAVKPYDKSAVK